MNQSYLFELCTNEMNDRSDDVPRRWDEMFVERKNFKRSLNFVEIRSIVEFFDSTNLTLIQISKLFDRRIQSKLIGFARHELIKTMKVSLRRILLNDAVFFQEKIFEFDAEKFEIRIEAKVEVFSVTSAAVVLTRSTMAETFEHDETLRKKIFDSRREKNVSKKKLSKKMFFSTFLLERRTSRKIQSKFWSFRFFLNPSGQKSESKRSMKFFSFLQTIFGQKKKCSSNFHFLSVFPSLQPWNSATNRTHWRWLKPFRFRWKILFVRKEKQIFTSPMNVNFCFFRNLVEKVRLGDVLRWERFSTWFRALPTKIRLKCRIKTSNLRRRTSFRSSEIKSFNLLLFSNS